MSRGRGMGSSSGSRVIDREEESLGALEIGRGEKSVIEVGCGVAWEGW